MVLRTARSACLITVAAATLGLALAASPALAGDPTLAPGATSEEGVTPELVTFDNGFGDADAVCQALDPTYTVNFKANLGELPASPTGALAGSVEAYDTDADGLDGEQDAIRFALTSGLADAVVVHSGGGSTTDAYVYTAPGIAADSGLTGPAYPDTNNVYHAISFVALCSDGEGDVAGPSADPLTVSKDAAGSYDTTYAWGIDKAVDKTVVKQASGSASFTYTVTLSHDAGTQGNVNVSGDIIVQNPNDEAVEATVTDTLSDGTACDVDGGATQTLAAGQTTLAYSCTLTAVPTDDLTNSVTVAWDEQELADGSALEAGDDAYTTDPIAFTQDALIDECVDVTDAFAGANPPTTLGQLCVGASDLDFEYTQSIPVKPGCFDYANVARFATTDSGATGSDGATVRVCGPMVTGALTIGFWQNKNGQSIISGQAKTGVCPSTAWLRSLAPFQDLSATATCSQVASYVFGVIKAADSSGASMNAMLKAQMLATALDVYFSDPALGGNKIGAPAPIGGLTVDLTKVCKNISLCTIYENVGPAFGGATQLTVSAMLTYAASQSNAGGTMWYGNVKAMQELAKDAFDAINNQKVFGV